MINVNSGWELGIERGPDWLIVRVKGPCSRGGEPAPLDEVLWSLVEQHSAHRLLLEFDQIESLSDDLINQLLAVRRRICERGGLLRVCGLTPASRKLLMKRGVDDRFVVYGDREHAMCGPTLPHRPR